METSENKRVWFITGASRGIGAEIASAALAAGDQVVATARDPRSITDRFGRPEALLPLALDVTDEASAAAAVEAAVARFGRIDVLVNNAGYGVVGAIEEAKSAVATEKVIADYAETAGKVRSYAKEVSLQQPGDPVRLARVVVELARAKNPPLRLPLGTDAIAAIEAKNAFVTQELAAWRAVSASTDFPK